jgi:hypothetical protein
MAAKTASLSVNIIADAAKAKAGLKEAETAFGKFSREVGTAQGAMGKFKTAGGAAFDYVKANAMNFAAAAGAAVVAFAVKSVNAFQDLTLTISKFSDATGMTLDSASRFIEVAGDIGIESSTLEKSLNFMNKTLGNSPQLFKDLGIEIEYTSGGAKDMSGTFLNVIDRINGITDPAEKAAVASKLLGRGWAEMAELIATGSGSLSKSLSEVSKSKIVTPEQERQAKDFRAATDNLKDSFEDFAQEVGGQLVPILTDAFDGISKFIDKAKQLNDIDVPGPAGLGDWLTFALRAGLDLPGAIKALVQTGEAVEEVNVVTEDMALVWQQGYRAMIDAVPPAQNLTSEIDRQKQALEDAKLAWDSFKGNLTMEVERRNIVADIEAFRVKWAGTTAEAKRNSEEYRDELLRLQIGVANFGGEVIATATVATQNKIRVLVETGQLERAVELLQYINKGTLGYVNTPTGGYAVTPYGAAVDSRPTAKAPPPPAKKTDKPVGQRLEYLSPLQQLDKIRTQRLAAMATGGTVVGSGMALVGEQGPELVNMPRGASVIPSIPSKRMLGSGQMIVNISVQAGLVSSPDQVGQQIIEAIRRAERRSGQVFAAA